MKKCGECGHLFDTLCVDCVWENWEDVELEFGQV